ncbi:MAG: LuxR family transcriptional regulator [Robiginitomaculum sp.]|nr:LuxR family transcriptional regulator [Robiginitomaculum sp.]
MKPASKIIFPEIEEVISALEESNSLPELKDYFENLIVSLGLTLFQLSEITDIDDFPGNNLSIGNLPDSYLKKYWRNGNYMFHDPIVRKTLTSNQPVRYSEYLTKADNPKRVQEIFNFRNKQGIKDGYGFPLKGRLNRFTLFNVIGDMSGFSKADIMQLEMYGISLYRRATELFPLQEASPVPDTVILTDRERECLTWVSKGKTNWDISQILMITERTVQYHVENAREKLGVDTRLQAVVAAAKLLEIVL